VNISPFLLIIFVVAMFAGSAYAAAEAATRASTGTRLGGVSHDAPAETDAT